MARSKQTMGVAWLLSCLVACSGGAGALGQTTTPPLDKPSAAPVQADAPSDLYKATAGPFDVQLITESWEDAARTRHVPVRVYVPRVKRSGDAEPAAAGEKSKFPVIVFSHGLGGSCVVYSYFGRHMASHGYIVVVPTHAGSDTAAAIAWVREGRKGEAPATTDQKMKAEQGWLTSSINDPENLKNRPQDISFVITKIGTHSVLGPIADLDRVGVAGHSFGAYTSMAVGGMTVDLPQAMGGRAKSFRDERVKAVLPMSPQGAGTMGISAGAWSKFGVPVLMMTGTHDYGSGGRSAAWRREAFEAIKTVGVDDYLVTLSGAGHMTFSNPGGKAGSGGGAGLGDGGGLGLGLGDRGGAGGGAGTEHDGDLIRAVSTAFFDTYLRGDAAAKDWLVKFCMAKRSDAVGEFKPAK